MGKLQKSDWSGGMTDYWYDSEIKFCKKLYDFVLDERGKPKLRDNFRHALTVNAGKPIDFIVDGTGTPYSYFTISDGKVFYSTSEISAPTYISTPKYQIYTAGVKYGLNSCSLGNHVVLFARGTRKPIIIYNVGYGTSTISESGFPDLVSGFVTSSNSDGNSYLYGLCWYRSYTAYNGNSNITYTHYGPVTDYQDTNASDLTIGGRYIKIYGNQSLPYTSTNIYDNPGSKINVYRTTNGGTVRKYVDYYRPTGLVYSQASCTVNTTTEQITYSTNHYLKDYDRVFFDPSGGTVPGGITAFTQYYVKLTGYDSFYLEATIGGGAVNLTSSGAGWVMYPGVIDTTLDANLGEEIYTTGGVVDSDQIGTCEVGCSTSDNYLWAIETSKTSRLRQFKQASVHAAPESFYLDFSERIYGLYAIDKYPIVMCHDGSVYRVEGRFDDTGNGTLIKIKIAEGFDLDEQATKTSGVVVNNILYVLGSKNVYAVTPFKAVSIADHLKDTLSTAVSNLGNLFVYGTYIKKDNVIAWTTNIGGTGDTNGILVLDLKYKSSKYGCLYFWDLSFGGYKCHSLREISGTVYIGTDLGNLMDNNQNVDYDGIVNNPATPSFKKRNFSPIYESCSYGMNANLQSKTFKSLNLKSLNSSDGEAYKFSAVVNDGTTYVDMKSLPYSDATSNMSIYRKVRFPRTAKRGYDVRVKIEKEWRVIYESASYDTVGISGTTVTLDSGSWPTDTNSYKNWFIYFSSDSYATGYEISSSTGSSLTVASAPGDGSGLDWKIKIIPADCEMKFQIYEIEFDQIDDDPSSYEAGDGE